MKQTLNFIHTTLLLIALSMLSACMMEDSKGKRRIKDFSDSAGLDNGEIGSGVMNDGDDGLGNSENSNGLLSPKVELRYMIDPFDGGFKSKMSIPKNFSGYLYLSGINISSLSGDFVYVRFKFGKDMQEIVVPATVTVGEGKGLSGSSQVRALALDLRGQPFKNINLIYDLFDYNDYGPEDVPTLDSRNGKLYCRGLKLEHDPTFDSTKSESCLASGDKCLYAYAKIADSGLYESTNNSMIVPSLSQVDYSGAGYNYDSTEKMLKKCLPNNGDLLYNSSTKKLTSSGQVAQASESGTDVLIHSGKTYKYKAPYIALDKSKWEIGPIASIHDHLGRGQTPRGLFMRGTLGAPTHSYLFPLAGKMDISNSIEYLGGVPNLNATDLTERFPFGVNKSKMVKGFSDTEAYADGCNFRATSKENASDEGIGSCNVTALIEVFTKSKGEEKIVAIVDDIKLQLLRTSKTDYQGKDVLFENAKTCDGSSAACGDGQCCFNNRCVGKDLVSQCMDDSLNLDKKPENYLCANDLECSSGCCKDNVCRKHDLSLFFETGEVAACAKPIDSSCIDKEFCANVDVVDVFLVKIKDEVRDDNGNLQIINTCRPMAFIVNRVASCINGSCAEPLGKTVDNFDPENPDCSNAIDASAIDPNTHKEVPEDNTDCELVTQVCSVRGTAYEFDTDSTQNEVEILDIFYQKCKAVRDGYAYTAEPSMKNVNGGAVQLYYSCDKSTPSDLYALDTSNSVILSGAIGSVNGWEEKKAYTYRRVMKRSCNRPSPLIEGYHESTQEPVITGDFGSATGDGWSEERLFRKCINK